jgi:8-oxo-dGTP diphosphatase
VSVPEPASADADRAASSPAASSPAAGQHAEWYARLPTMFGAAAALFTNRAGQVLLVKPNYRDHWTLPGGILEDGEPPHAGCRREVAEETGIDLTPGPLLVIDWVAPDGDRPKPIVHFVFDGGVLDDGVRIRLQAEELDDHRFVDPRDLDGYLPPFMSARVLAGLRGRADGTTVYLPRPQAPR